MIQAMLLSSFLVACVAFMAAAVHLRKAQGDEDLDGVREMAPAPLPTLPAAAAVPAEAPLPPAQPTPSPQAAPALSAPSPALAAPEVAEPAPVAAAEPVAVDLSARPAARGAKNSGFARFSTPAASRSTRAARR